ncbi:MAG TPA: hypothetical protein VFV19_17225 [Candidatus Polarisedimenticolaceae bacterium]|nr:hypothetical protein [Candidatus Polarisedimenticolaceae bacterium]
MKRFLAFTMFGVLAIGLPAFAAGPTVGNFYTRLAQAKKLEASGPVAAEASLRGAGYTLPALSLDKALTEGDVASIAGALGLNVTTTRPGNVVTDTQVNSFMTGFSAQLQTGAKAGSPTPYQIDGSGTGGTDPGNSGNGKGKKKGHNKSPSEPL